MRMGITPLFMDILLLSVGTGLAGFFCQTGAGHDGRFSLAGLSSAPYRIRGEE
ncbi:hypothetical protein [Desulfurispora thermophila]|uniref:hypothetical protein n=1 Tax=Desulfurispora thermophila TaxID=265470 RepID=UPI0012E9DDFD|nr:hypothetical protein [Desulfurispora thermophila]